MVTMSSKHLNAQYNLRWPDDLKEKIAQSAKEHNRSMNADIIARLEESFEEKTMSHDFFKKNLYFFLASYCAGIESNYDKAIAQVEELLAKTKDPEAIQLLEHKLQVNKILKEEINRLMKNNSEKFSTELSLGAS